MRFYTESSLGEKRKLTPEGFMIAEDVPIARIGEMTYGASEIPGLQPGPDGTIKMSRSSDELFSPETIASFEGKPLIIPTGDVHVSGVDSDTWEKHAVGHIQNVRESGDLLIADIVVNDSKAIEQINNGLRELSCGYEYIARQTSSGRGEQSAIRGNHVALVQNARGGSQLKIGDRKPMKVKNPLLRLFAHAVTAGDEEAQQDIEKSFEGAKVKTGDELNDDLMARISTLEAKITALSGKRKAGDKKRGADMDDEDDEDDEDKDMAGDEDDEEEDKDEEEGEEEDEKEKVGDSAKWQKVIAGAAILAPDLVIERKGKIGDAMRKVLSSVPHVKRKIGDSKITGSALQLTFDMAVDAQKAKNNLKTQTGDGASFSTFSGQASGGFEIVRGNK